MKTDRISFKKNSPKKLKNIVRNESTDKEREAM